MSPNLLHTVELWKPEHLTRLLKIDTPAADSRQALALALRHMKELGMPVHDNVRMLVKETGAADVDALVFSARDIRVWLKEPEQADFVNQEHLEGLLK